MPVLSQNVPGLPLFHGLPPSMPVWMSHGDRIVETSPGLRAPRLHGKLPHSPLPVTTRACWEFSSIPR